MASRQTGKAPTEQQAHFPMDQATWKAVAKSLSLPPQQFRIVENLLCGKQDKEIAETLGLTVPTVRTYLKRIFERVGAKDRVSLILTIFAKAQEVGRTTGLKHHR
jgi:DNA-binding NarL/FixJ family response regulator